MTKTEFVAKLAESAKISKKQAGVVFGEAVGDLHVLIGNLLGIGSGDALVEASLLQVLAIERAVQGNFPGCAAANGADLAPHRWAQAARPPCLTDSAAHW